MVQALLYLLMTVAMTDMSLQVRDINGRWFRPFHVDDKIQVLVSASSWRFESSFRHSGMSKLRAPVEIASIGVSSFLLFFSCAKTKLSASRF